LNGVVEREQEKEMNRLRSAGVLFGLLAAAGLAQAQDFKQRFVGKSPCTPDIQSEFSGFSLRLDKTQDLTLLYRDLSAVKVVMIIEPNGSGDHCGVIRDVVQITRIAKDFEFRCFDPHAPTDVTIGTSIRKGSTKPVTAIDAWRVDLKEQKFIETNDKVTCTDEGWEGEDDGSDLVDAAKEYATHHRPGRFADEQHALTRDTQVTPLVQVTIDGEPQKAKLIEGNQPKYPEEALKRRITGTVGLHVVFDKDGNVRLAEPISGQPLFAHPAVDAVRQWKYPPTIMNGEPVEIDTLVFVKFSLVGAKNTNP
jgi:TonB family protein